MTDIELRHTFKDGSTFTRIIAESDRVKGEFYSETDGWLLVEHARKNPVDAVLIRQAPVAARLTNARPYKLTPGQSLEFRTKASKLVIYHQPNKT